jgi:hypothetical protein
LHSTAVVSPVCKSFNTTALFGFRLSIQVGRLDAHYLARDPALRESAIRKLETGTKSPN